MTNITILSWNIYWKANSIINNKPKIENCDLIKFKNNVMTSCTFNIINTINSNPSDIVCLQEATEWKLIRKNSRLNKMNFVTYQSSLEELITFYDPNKFELEDKNGVIIGCIANQINRPFMILFFKQKICIINVHSDHQKGIINLSNYISQALYSQKHIATVTEPGMVFYNYRHTGNSYNSDEFQNIVSRLEYYDIIIAGDMNYDFVQNKFNFEKFNQNFKIFNKNFSGLHTDPTCCFQTVNNMMNINKKPQRIYDYILTTSVNITSRAIITNYTASDHYPIYANVYIGYKYAYDFDGVIHKSISECDIFGQCHPISNNFNEYEPNIKILNNIIDNLKSGHQVYIVTARDSKSKKYISKYLYKWISQLISQKQLLEFVKNIPIYTSENQCKTMILKNIRANYFYDDSKLRINETCRDWHNLPDLKKIIHVIYQNKKSKYIHIRKNI